MPFTDDDLRNLEDFMNEGGGDCLVAGKSLRDLVDRLKRAETVLALLVPVLENEPFYCLQRGCVPMTNGPVEIPSNHGPLCNAFSAWRKEAGK